MTPIFISSVIVSCSLSGASKHLVFDNVYDVDETGTIRTPRAGLTIRELSLEYPTMDRFDALRELLHEDARRFGYHAITIGFYNQHDCRIDVDEIRLDFNDLDLSDVTLIEEIPCGLFLEHTP